VIVPEEGFVEQIDWDKTQGLIPAVVQDADTGRVLMLGYMNKEAIDETNSTGFVTFWSRSRQRIWQKGETSGHRLELQDLYLDCDRDTVLVTARPMGPTCHTGRRSCFQEDQTTSAFEFLPYLERFLLSRKKELPEESYTASLLRDGEAAISRKVGEEALEVMLSIHEDRQRTIEESADLLYHLIVLLVSREQSLQDVIAELRARHESN
jgi:phosphoribosyl-ATP pyrophosphohydrolase/phosphoribosyl-AMP cyclohydrolase